MKTRLHLLAAAAFFIAAPLALAQTEMPPSSPPPIVTPTPAEPGPPEAKPTTPVPMPVPPAPPVAPEPGAVPKAPDAGASASTAAATTISKKSCRTRKDVGNKCACLSDPSQIGTSEAASDGGKNVCNVP